MVLIYILLLHRDTFIMAGVYFTTMVENIMSLFSLLQWQPFNLIQALKELWNVDDDILRKFSKLMGEALLKPIQKKTNII